MKILSSAERGASAAPAAGGIIPSLDGIRAVSVMLVVVAHAGFERVPGGLGVTIFFFLSGYLISTLMLGEHERTGRLDIPKFYARRVFRLMPPLIVTLAIAYGLAGAGLLSGGISIAGLLSQLLYFANYYFLFFDPGDTVPSGTSILWSLAVEEHFYIFYPMFMALLLGAGGGTRRFRMIAVLLGTVCAVVLAWRIHLVHAPGFVIDRTYFASDTRIDSIIYGCLLALLKNPVRDLQSAPPPKIPMSAGQWAILAAAAGAMLFTLVYRDPAFRETVRYSLQGLALMPIFYFAVRFSGNPLFSILNSPLAKRLGTYSYVIYLIHYVMIGVIDTDVPAIAGNPFIVLPAVLLVSIAYAAAIDNYIDPYFRRLRHKFQPARADQAGGAQAVRHKEMAAE